MPVSTCPRNVVSLVVVRPILVDAFTLDEYAGRGVMAITGGPRERGSALFVL